MEGGVDDSNWTPVHSSHSSLASRPLIRQLLVVEKSFEWDTLFFSYYGGAPAIFFIMTFNKSGNLEQVIVSSLVVL